MQGCQRKTRGSTDCRNGCFYALGVPGHRFAEAAHWLENRVPLLADQNGRVEFFFEQWNAHAIYFRDADGNIGELIARHNLETNSEEPFGARSLLGVSEIGWVFDHTKNAAIRRNYVEKYLSRTKLLDSCTTSGC